MSQSTQNELKKFISLAGASIRNPLDTGLVFRDVSTLKREMELVAADPMIDMLIVMPHLDMARHGGLEQVDQMVEYLLDFARNNPAGKPVALIFNSFANDPWESELRSRLRVELPNKGIPVYGTLAGAGRALARLAEYYRFQEAPATER